MANERSPISSYAWKTAQSITTLGTTFVVQLILARMLLPEDFGLVAIVNVFLVLATTIVETSFSSAIIQRDSISQKLLSSIFFINALLSVCVYLILFLASPLLSAFYSEKILTPLLRVQSISIIISALFCVPQALMNRKMRFKALFFAYLSGSLFQAVSGITLAYAGYGVWALVLSSCISVLTTGVMIIILERWMPSLYLSFPLIKNALSYSSKILVVRVVKKIYYNVRVLAVGKVYSAQVLGLFNKGFQFPSTAMTVVDGSLTSVSFTHLSKLQNDKEKLLSALRSYIRFAMFISTPMMIGLALVARPLVLVLLGQRWLGCVPYLQIICISQLFIPLSIKTTAFEALGKSGTSMKLNLTGIFLSLALLLISVPFSPIVMTWGGVVANILLQLFITPVSSRELCYGVYDQINDALSGAIPTFVMAIAITALQALPFEQAYLAELISKVALGVLSFLITAILTKNETLFSLFAQIKNNSGGKCDE